MAAISQSLEDYLEAIYVLETERHSAQVRDVAKALEVTMPSVVRAIRELVKLGYATHEPYADIMLTTKGRKIARRVTGLHTLLRTFLEKLGVARRTADRDACLMEHILSAETIDKIRGFTEGMGAR